MRLLIVSITVWLLSLSAGFAQEGPKPRALKDGESLTPMQKVGKWTQATPESLAKTIGGAYTAHGPGPLTGGQTEGIAGGHVSGAIEAFAIHPTDPAQIWVGSVNGGIHYSTNATAGSPSWTPQGDAFSSMSIATLELDPTDTTDPRTLVAGVGARSSYISTAGAITGVLRTTDSGATWTLLPGMATRHISGLAARGATIVAAVNFGTPFAFGNIGIWRSTDTGATWTQISGAVGSGLPDGVTYDLASDPTDPTRLYTVVTSAPIPADTGVYRSTDTGATWTKISSAGMDADLASLSRCEIAVGTAGTAQPATTENVFVAIVSAGVLSSLWHSLDSGGTWASLAALPSIHPGGQGGTHLSIVAHPTLADVCFIGGDRQPSPFPNPVGALNFSGRLYRVDFSPQGFSHITHSNTTSNSSPHADSREMLFDSNGDLVETDDGGIYKHTDPDLTTGDWVSLNGNLQVNEQHDMAYDEISSIITTGNQDTGSGGQSSTGSVTWDTYAQGDGGDADVGLNDTIAGNSMRYRAFTGYPGSATRREYTSANGFVGSTSLSLTPLGGDPAVGGGSFTTPIAVNRAVPARMLIGASNGVYESMDRGGTVSQISTLTVNHFGTGPLVYGTAGNNDALYFGSDDDVYIRTAAPPTAPAMSAAYAAMPGTTGDDVVDIDIDPDDYMHAFVIDSDQVFRTTDAGASWTDVTDILFTMFSPGRLRSIAYMNGMAGKDGVAVGANVGVYAALEIAAGTPFTAWDTLGTSLPNCPVFDLRFSNTDDVLVAGTMGRGSFALTPIIANLPIELLSYEIE